VEQGDAAVAVRVVLDRRDHGGHAVLGALEVDDAVPLLVTAAAVAGRLAAEVVPAPGAVLRGEERPLRLVGGELGEVGDRLEAATGAGGLALAKCHGC
jgi:hypothetical protein